MLISWNWLKQYVLLDMPVEELERRLMMAGLNHESTEHLEGDLAIDLEVTSNRPDCLGHIGVAREVAVLWERELKIPPASPAEEKTPVEQLTSVRIDCEDLCFRYIARVIRGVKVAPSPDWMVRRLETIGLMPINNVVDASNYVLMECGQPLHTFDHKKLKGGKIVVRRPRAGEKIEAIDHKTYELTPEMCVIADAENPVAIGGVMGGASTEVSARTTDILVEAAEFDPLSIRNTARRLNLHSDSSYRFERRVDPEGLDWASRRCCELIIELGGGRLAAGAVDVGQKPPDRKPVVLRFSQLKRILGIDVPVERVRQILLALGNVEDTESKDWTSRAQKQARISAGDERITLIPPSWRRDLSREIDLVEEVGRIYGYDQIPEDVAVPMAPSTRTREDRVLQIIRDALTAAGMDEAYTLSVVDQQSSAAMTPWTAAEPLRTISPVIRGADCLRRSLIPSLLGARRTNEALSNPHIELFEIAKIYLPRPEELPEEKLMLGITSGGDYLFIKGVIEALVGKLKSAVPFESCEATVESLDRGRSCQLRLGDKLLGFVGQVLPEAQKAFDLRNPTVVADHSALREFRI
ncbi:MAG: phenylalanine--tRNA ligase subunit beta, partial [Thermoguttaceae bacterium]